MLAAIPSTQITEGVVYAFPTTDGLGAGQLWHIKKVLKTSAPDARVFITARGLTSTVDTFDVTDSEPRPYDGKAVYAEDGTLTFKPNARAPAAEPQKFPEWYDHSVTISTAQRVVRVYAKGSEIAAVMNHFSVAAGTTNTVKIGEIKQAPWPFTTKITAPRLWDAVPVQELITKVRKAPYKEGNLDFWPLVDVAYTPETKPRVVCTVAVYWL